MKIIKAKDLCILEDHKIKLFTELLIYNDKPTFLRFFFENNNEGSEKLSSTCAEGQKVKSTKRKKVFETNTCTKDTKAAKPSSTIPAYIEDTRATNTSIIPARTEDTRANSSITTHSNQRFFACSGQEPQDARATSSITKSRSGCIIKLSTKAREVMI